MRHAIYAVIGVVIVCASYWIFTITSATANMHTRLKMVESQLSALKELKDGRPTSIQP